MFEIKSFTFILHHYSFCEDPADLGAEIVRGTFF